MIVSESVTGSDQAAGAPADEIRVTRFSDVCGGTDELKRLVTEEQEFAASPAGREASWALVDDGQYMLARMGQRLREYQAFCDELAAVVETMRRLEAPRLDEARREAGRLRELLAREGPLPSQEIAERAEAIRQVANETEGAMRRHKEACIAAGRAYLRVKGMRGWEDGGALPAASAAGVGAESLPRGVPEAWLPPSPHRERILEFLRDGRATLLSEEEAARFPPGLQGREPLVQFYGGGVIPLRAVRWSDAVQNFYPLGSEPHPRGALYRPRRRAAPRAAE